jgi:hypothetical protein
VNSSSGRHGNEPGIVHLPFSCRAFHYVAAHVRSRNNNRRNALLHLAHRDHRNGETRAADGAHATRPDRHDDHGSGIDWQARRPGGGGRGARAPHSICGLRARHGPCVSRCSVGRPGLWSAPAAAGAAVAAHGALGRRNRRRSGQCGAALGRRYPARSGSIPGIGRACGTLPFGSHLVDDAGLGLHRYSQFHGRGQSPGTRSMSLPQRSFRGDSCGRPDCARSRRRSA